MSHLSNDPDSDEKTYQQARRRLRKWVWVFGILLAVDLGCVAMTYGDAPLMKVGRDGRSVIAFVGMVSLTGFLVTGGLYSTDWVLDHFSDARKPRSDMKKDDR